MPEIVTMGELICEIMRPSENMELYETGTFRGPFPSGAPGIFISTAARLGCSTAIISGVGKDDFGKNILDRLKKDHVDVSAVLESETGYTGVAFVTYYTNGNRKFLFHVDGTPAVEALAPSDMGKYRDTRYFHVMGCSLMASKRFGEQIKKAMYQFREQGAKISFDPNVRPELMHDPSVLDLMREVCRNANIFMPGVSELLMLTGKDQVGPAVAAAFQNPELELLVLKNGAKGAMVYGRKGLIANMGVYPVKQLDATGAGDCFDAAFLCGLVQGRTPEEAIKMGAAAGALNAAAFGPMEGDISIETVRSMIENNVEEERKWETR